MREEKKYSVVIADDHEVFRIGLRIIAQDMGCFSKIAEASDGDSAISLVRDLVPTLLILDYSMPGKSGLDVLDEINRGKFDTRVLVLTANRSEALLAEVLANGANGFL